MQYTKDFNRIDEWITSLENDTGCSFRTISSRLKDEVYLLAIVRGLPGSGKTTIANYICKNFECSKVEADDYMTGTCKFTRPTRIQLIDIHKRCNANLLNLNSKHHYSFRKNANICINAKYLGCFANGIYES